MKDTGHHAGVKNKTYSTVTIFKQSKSASKKLAASHPYAKRRHKKQSACALTSDIHQEKITLSDSSVLL
jgi:hypothetical protein